MAFDGFPAATHGGADAQGVPLHDFSTNANACGPCPHTLRALRAADASHYPDPHYTALRGALADWHGVAPERIVLAASASEFIARMTAAVGLGGGRAVELPRHAYGDYTRAARARGLAVRIAVAPEDLAGVAPAASGSLADADADADAPALVWACDPASPRGTAQPGLAARIDALPPDLPLVLDRAYEPLRLHGNELAVPPAALDRVWQLWSPNKALGLTGVRGAYAIAPGAAAEQQAQAALHQRLHDLAPSWVLGAHGVAMLHDWVTPTTQQWLAGCLPTLRDWKAAQQALCRALGWQVGESEANYFCAAWPPLPGIEDPATVLQQLRGMGIKLRDTASFGLPGQVRLGVRPPASQAALRVAWAKLARR